MKDSGERLAEHTHCIADELIDDYPHLKTCGSSDALSIYEHDDDGEIKYDAFCWSCAQKFDFDMVAKSSIAKQLGVASDGSVKEPKKFKKKPKAEPLTRSQVNSLIKKIGYNSKGYRGISDKANKWYGHLTKLDSKGNVVARYYPETEKGVITGYKCRNHPKDFRFGKLGKTGITSDLSGQVRWKKGGGKYVLIVGGEEDKAAAFQMFQEYQESKGYSDYDPMSVVCPTTGEGSSHVQLAEQYEWLDTFDNIVLGFDVDKAGKKAIEKCCEVLPAEKVLIATWSGKDPNDMLEKGKDKQFIRDFYNAKEYISSGIKGSGEIYQEVEEFLLTPKLTLPPFMHRLQTNMRGGIGFGRIVNIIADSSVGKCLGFDTPVLMADNTVKMVQDVQSGDKIMGDDGSIRNVLSICTGRENLYKIHQKRGLDYIVNESHILSLESNSTRLELKQGEVVDIAVKDYLKLNPSGKSQLTGYIADMKKLGKGHHVEDPYMVGLWLAEGSSAKPQFTFSNKDLELREWLYEWVKEKNYTIKIYPTNYRESCTSYNVNGGLKVWLRGKNLLDNKHIPTEYLCSDYEDRLELLSGIIDGDGYLHNNVSYELTLKNNKLAENVLTLARSLGFRVTATVVNKSCQNNFTGEYLRMFISGDMSKLKLKVKRKIAKNRTTSRNPRRTSISVEYLGQGDYYGFEIDGNKRFCLGDGTVTHNTTLVNSMVYHWVMQCIDIAKTGIISLESTAAEYALDMLSIHLGMNLQAIPEGGEVLQLLDSPEVKEKYNDLFTLDNGQPRFHLVDERDGKISVVEAQMERMVKQYGVKVLVIDVTSDLLRSLENSKQEQHMMWQKRMVKNGVIIINVLHTRKPPADNRGVQRKATEYDAIGSSAFVQSGHINIVFNRDKMHDDVYTKNKTIVDMPKCRGGITGHACDWYYDWKTRAMYDYEDYFADKDPEDKEVDDVKKEQVQEEQTSEEKSDNVPEFEIEGGETF